MARCEREAQVLASLNHPNIAAVYGVEKGALIMELVETDDLKGPIPIETAFHLSIKFLSRSSLNRGFSSRENAVVEQVTGGRIAMRRDPCGTMHSRVEMMIPRSAGLRVYRCGATPG